MSTCSGACATDWPPLTTTGKPSAGTGVTADARHDHAVRRVQQLTYNGHPLYLLLGDQSAADTNGQGLNFFGANWYVSRPRAARSRRARARAAPAAATREAPR